MTPVIAGVRSTSEMHAYRVPGATARSVVSYMLRNPFPGDHGGAFANIRPRYKLFVDTKENGGICRARDVDLNVHFVVTLPEATDIERMSARTRSAWHNFVTYARRHEEGHRISYVGCAKRFVAEAKRETAATCHALESRIRRALQQARRDCEAKQSAYDRQRRNGVRGLALFNMAGY